MRTTARGRSLSQDVFRIGLWSFGGALWASGVVGLVLLALWIFRRSTVALLAISLVFLVAALFRAILDLRNELEGHEQAHAAKKSKTELQSSLGTVLMDAEQLKGDIVADAHRLKTAIKQAPAPAPSVPELELKLQAWQVKAIKWIKEADGTSYDIYVYTSENPELDKQLEPWPKNAPNLRPYPELWLKLQRRMKKLELVSDRLLNA